MARTRRERRSEMMMMRVMRVRVRGGVHGCDGRARRVSVSVLRSRGERSVCLRCVSVQAELRCVRVGRLLSPRAVCWQPSEAGGKCVRVSSEPAIELGHPCCCLCCPALCPCADDTPVAVAVASPHCSSAPLLGCRHHGTQV